MKTKQKKLDALKSILSTKEGRRKVAERLKTKKNIPRMDYSKNRCAGGGTADAQR